MSCTIKENVLFVEGIDHIWAENRNILPKYGQIPPQTVHALKLN